MKKKERQEWIQAIIEEQEISKQEELVTALWAKGIEVTQATVSRDMKEMGLEKVPATNKAFKYTMPQQKHQERLRLEKLLRTSFVRVERMDKFITLMTVPGSGFAIGNLIQDIFDASLFTVMSNDDKVLMIAYTDRQAIDLETNLKMMK